MKRSEIFESFVKIAQERGLVSEADHAEHTEKDFHETNPRHDSLSIEQISKLYNTKPEQPEDMKYKKNIMEDAHPKPVVLFMSHDKLNSLVENEIEGQNIRLRIVTKEPDGHLVNRKYATDELIHSLVKIANDLDNRDQEDLCKLADACLMQTAGFRKDAFPWLFAGIVAAIGAIYAKQHLRFHSDGFKADLVKANEEIDDLLKSNSNLGVGYTYTPAFIQTVQKLKLELTKLGTAVQGALPIIEKIETPKTGPELKQIAAQPATHEAQAAIDKLKQAIEEVYPFINQTIVDFSNEGYKQRAIAKKGLFTSWIDAAEILHGGGGLIADDFDDVKRAMETLKVDIDNVVKDLQGSENAQQQAQQQLANAQTEQQKLFSSTRAPGSDQSGTQTSGTQAGGSQPAGEQGGALSALEHGFNALTGR